MTTDYNNRAARGQALNLAVQDALHTRTAAASNGNNISNADFRLQILNNFVDYLEFSEYLQSIDIKILKESLGRK